MLLLLDGHDEYKVGTNTEIDEAIQKDLYGSCCIVITSRTSLQLIDIRKYMDMEVDILGFDEKTAQIYARKYLNDTQKATDLIAKIKTIESPKSISNSPSSLQTLTKLPILLQMLCVLHQGKAALPDSKGGIIDALIRRSIQRSALKTSGKKLTGDIFEVLQRLGKAAWESLTQDTKQLIIPEVST